MRSPAPARRRAGAPRRRPTRKCAHARASRADTPISTEEERGYLDLVVKAYPAPDGVMSRHIHSLRPGDKLEFKGPWPKIEVRPNKWKKIGMVAGGTGITPMLQVVRAVVNNPSDVTGTPRFGLPGRGANITRCARRRGLLGVWQRDPGRHPAPRRARR